MTLSGFTKWRLADASDNPGELTRLVMRSRREKSQNANHPPEEKLERNPNPLVGCSRDSEGAIAMHFSSAKALRRPADAAFLRATPGEGPRGKFDSPERPSDTLLKPAPLHRSRWIEPGH